MRHDYRWLFALLPALSAGVAFFELDAVHLGQGMLSRPIVLGPLLGLACGRAGLGAGMGALMEMFCLDRRPVGGLIPLSASVAAGCAVLLCSGPNSLAASAALPAALLLGLGHSYVEERVRLWRSGLNRNILAALESQGGISWGKTFALGVFPHWAATLIFVYASVALLEPALADIWTASPLFIQRGMNTALYAAPWLGAAAMFWALAKGA